MKREFLEPVVKYAESRIVELMSDGDRGLILVTRDSDGECPVYIGNQINDIAGISDDRVMLEVVVCNREFEAWFLAGSSAYGGMNGCVLNPPVFFDADILANPKATFEAQILSSGTQYSETIDQPRFASTLDFTQQPQLHSRSLRRFTSVLAAATNMCIQV